MTDIDRVVHRIAAQVNLPVEAVRAVLAAMPELGYYVCEGRK